VVVVVVVEMGTPIVPVAEIWWELEDKETGVSDGSKMAE
jgi:hypothetical protein